MKKGNRIRKLGRKSNQRRALIKGLTAALFLHGRITTTLAKAKSAQPFAERLISHARKGTLAARRLAQKRLPKEAARALYQEIAPRFTNRPGGYTRIIKLKPRASDTAPQVLFELVVQAKKETPPPDKQPAAASSGKTRASKTQ